MPIFFIICGILTSLNEKKEMTNKHTLVYEIITIKRIKQLFIPYYFFSFILAIFFFILDYASRGNFRIIDNLVSIIKFDGLCSLWFLPCYFFSETILKSIIAIKNNLSFKILLSIGIPLSCLIVIIYLLNVNLFYKILISEVFCLSGYFISHLNIIEKIKKWQALLGFSFLSFTGCMNGYVGIGGLQLGNQLLFFMNGIFLSLFLIAILYSHENLRIWKRFEYWGIYSIIVLCTNNLYIEIIRLIDYKFTGNLLLNSNYLGILLFTIILIIIEKNTIKVAKEKLMFLFGKK